MVVIDLGVRSFLAGRGIEERRETLVALARRKDGYFLERVAREGVEVFNSAVRLVREARARDLRTAVASFSRNCAAILRAARLSALFEARVDGLDLERFGLAGKPAPDMFLEAARRLEVAPRGPPSSRTRRPASRPAGRAASASSSGWALPSTRRRSGLTARIPWSPPWPRCASRATASGGRAAEELGVDRGRRPRERRRSSVTSPALRKSGAASRGAGDDRGSSHRPRSRHPRVAGRSTDC
jgi:hypothetical protein